jgi:branched-chain amino acid transport system ATP-binding protein
MSTTTTAQLALEVEDLNVQYGARSLALRGVSLQVPQGQIVSLMGPNGAGKSTLMRAISGLLPVHSGTMTAGRVSLQGQDVTSARPSARVRAGLAQALEGRQVFADLTVAENLSAGGYVRRRGKAGDAATRAHVLEFFPRLGDLMQRKAGYLSGGEQQMLAIGRAMMSEPTVLLLDEPSLGLAPKLVEAVRDVIVAINGTGTSVLLVEQNAAMALSIAHHGYVLEGGRIVKEGTAESLRSDQQMRDFYLGVASPPPAIVAATSPHQEA